MEAVAAWQAGVAILTTVRRWRSEQKVSPGKPLARVAVRAASTLAMQATAVAQDVKAACRIERLELAEDLSLEAGAVVLDAVEIAEA